MDKLKAIEVYDDSQQKKIKVYVSIPVAQKCETDKAFAEELYQQLKDQNIEDGSVLEIEIETVQSEAPHLETRSELKRDIDEDEPEDSKKGIKRRKICDPNDKEIWTRNQTVKFLKAYQQCKKKKQYGSEKELWSAVARELLKYGISKHYSKCKSKFHNLVRTYKATTNKKNAGSLNSRFEFFQEMGEVMKGLSSEDMIWLKDSDGDENADSDAISEDASQHDDEDDASVWSGNETLKLINICRKNKTALHKGNSQQIWKIISSVLGKLGVQRDPEQCKRKWDSLKQSYEKSLSSNMKFDLFDEMQSALSDQNGAIHLSEDEDVEDSNDEEDDDDDDIFKEIEEMKKEYMKNQMTYDVNKQTVSTDNTYSWKYKEITSLIEAYGLHKDKFENQTDSPKSVWEQISAELKKNNILKSAESCEKKWKSLFDIYTAQKESNLRSDKFIYFNAINSIFNIKQEDEEGVVSHENRCKCSEKRQLDKQQRHMERMEMLGRKLDLEERKITAFEEYMSYLKHKLINGKK